MDIHKVVTICKEFSFKLSTVFSLKTVEIVHTHSLKGALHFARQIVKKFLELGVLPLDLTATHFSVPSLPFS